MGHGERGQSVRKKCGMMNDELKTGLCFSFRIPHSALLLNDVYCAALKA
jgi:hypothetical protein